METEDHIPKAEHIDPIKSCLIRDDLHMRVPLRSKGQLLTPALKEIGWTRGKCLLHWHSEKDMKTSSSWMRTFSQTRSSIRTNTTRFMLKHPLICMLRVQEAITLFTSWFVGGCPIGGSQPFVFVRKV
jgi:hypothetical protein